MNGYCTMLAIGNYGRFCNQAYQIAGVFGVARRNGLAPVFPLWQNKDHAERFGSTEDIDVYRHFIHPLPAIPEGLQFQQERPVEWGYHEVILPPGNWNLSGHFQSPKYFAHCLDEVKWYFRMVEELPQNDYCAVHIRLGDYDNAYHPRLGISYYGRAMAEFGSGQKFLVFSDDIPAAREILSGAGPGIEYSEGRDYLADFRLMKSCRHFIVGNSSYSAFAAVLGEAEEKRVVAPSPWFGPKYTSITGDDIYDKDWTVINYLHRR